MPEPYASQVDLNGFGDRLNDIDKSLAGCQGASRERMAAMERDVATHKDSIARLYECTDSIKQQLNALTVRITMIVGIIVVIGQTFMPFIMDLIKGK